MTSRQRRLCVAKMVSASPAGRMKRARRSPASRMISRAISIPRPRRRKSAQCLRIRRRWMRSGDLMRKDARGFFYFLRPHRRQLPLEGRERIHGGSRAGDCRLSRRSRRAVYGVEAPGCDGRAGMAAIVADETFDVDALPYLRRAPAGLRAAAVPAAVVRLALTATFKHRKRELADQGLILDSSLTLSFRVLRSSLYMFRWTPRFFEDRRRRRPTLAAELKRLP